MKIDIRSISIIIPVKDNQSGINRFLESFFDTHPHEGFPTEIIIVDNNSDEPIFIPEPFLSDDLDIQVFLCSKPGPASARNYGAKHTTGDWLLFVDSDCIPTSSMISGYLLSEQEAVGYQGFVAALGKDFVSQYYESQKIHQPPLFIDNDGNITPKYLVTANILINKKSFFQINGFNEGYVFGGEDVDFGLRLSKIGALEYAKEAIVLHNYDDGLKGFVRRFIEYGKGNRLVEKYHDIHLIPFPFTAKNKRIIVNHVLAILQWVCLLLGYIQMHWQIKKKG